MKTLRLLNKNGNNSVAIAFLDRDMADRAYQTLIQTYDPYEVKICELEIPHGKMIVDVKDLCFFSLIDNDAMQEDMLELRKREIEFQAKIAAVGVKKQ